MLALLFLTFAHAAEPANFREVSFELTSGTKSPAGKTAIELCPADFLGRVGDKSLTWVGKSFVFTWADDREPTRTVGGCQFAKRSRIGADGQTVTEHHLVNCGSNPPAAPALQRELSVTSQGAKMQFWTLKFKGGAWDDEANWVQDAKILNCEYSVRKKS